MAKQSETETAWYWAAALFKSVHVGKPRRRHLWQRSVFLVRAGTAPKAAQRAEALAVGMEHEYKGGTGDFIRWQFQSIEAIHPLDGEEVGEGAEVYWQFYEKVDPL